MIEELQQSGFRIIIGILEIYDQVKSVDQVLCSFAY